MKKYLINQDIHKMTDEIYLQLSEEDGNTSKTVNRLPDDESYIYDIFIPREYCINPFPQRWPKSKKTRIMVGAIDSPYYDAYKERGELINFDTFWLFETATELRTDEVYIGYEDGDISKKVEVRIGGVLSEFKATNDILLSNEGQKIFVKNIGERIKNPELNKTDKNRYVMSLNVMGNYVN